MAKKCEMCGKTGAMAQTRVKLRGKYNPTAKKRKYPNLQRTRLPNGQRVWACAKCIKAQTKVR